MLLKMKVLEGIRDGSITLAFRRWKRPTVREGGELKTRIGVLAIDQLREVPMRSISEADARQAGFDSRAELLEELRGREGKVYRVALHLAGADPRIALRADTKLSKIELAAIEQKLDRMDARTKDGAWTRQVLRLIRTRPGVRAPDLAEELDMETAKFKPRVRKLKALGLTESLEVGYRLSPRGEVVFRHLG